MRDTDKELDSIYKASIKKFFPDLIPRSHIELWTKGILKRRLELFFERITSAKFGVLCRKCGINSSYHPCNDEFKKLGKELKDTGTIKKITCHTCQGHGKIGK